MPRLFQDLAKPSMLLLTGVVTLFLTWLLFTLYSSLPNLGSREVLLLQFAFTPENFLQITNRWGPIGVDTFLLYMPYDYLYPIFYGLFFSGLLARGKHASSFVISLPLWSAGFDFVENSLHTMILAGPLPMTAVTVFLASAMATLKYSGIFVAWGVLLKNIKTFVNG